jgi:DNA-binding GntR family transcriptional regulator
MAGIDPIGNPEYTYVQVADDLAARIRAGEFPAGRLPSERALAAGYKVGYQTLRHAMQVLRGRGLIATRQGRGTFIVRPPAPPG